MDQTRFLCVGRVETILRSALRNFRKLGTLPSRMLISPRWATSRRSRGRPPDAALLLVPFNLKDEFRLEHRTGRVADFDCHPMT